MQFLLVLFLCYLHSDAHKILVYNMKFAHSHCNFLGNIADILVDAGHDVTSFIPVISTKIKDGTTKSKVIYVPPHPEAAEIAESLHTGSIDLFSFSELNLVVPFIMGRDAGTMFTKQCEATLDSGEIEKLQEEKFDVYIVESFDVCGMMLAHLIQPRAIIYTGTTTLVGQLYDELGVPMPLSYNPSMLTRSLDVHSLYSRAWNILAEMLTRVSPGIIRNRMERLFRQRFGPDYPSLQQISSNVAYAFANSEPLIDFATPTMSRVITLGGLGAKEPKELDEYWTSLMTVRPKVVLISFGSMAKSYLMEPSVKHALLKVFTAFPSVTFIWKYEKKDEFALGDAAKAENLVLTDWMPQNDLLNHPNLAVFVTHGGMGSVQELAIRGKPAILIPIFGDQPRNAAMIDHNKLGKVLSKMDIGNSEIFVALLKEVMENPEYAENSRRVARMLAKKPFSSKEKLLKYVDFAAEFGPSTALRPQSADMTLIEYHNLDIILAFAVLVLLISLSLLCIIISNLSFNSVCSILQRLQRITTIKLKNE